MVRTFVTLEGEVLATEDWTPTASPKNVCFWCDDHLIGSEAYTCPFSFDGTYDWVTICNRDYA